MSYPKERKEAVLKKMLPPINRPIAYLAKEEGIAEGTLYGWRKQARSEGRLMPDGDNTPQNWNASDKFSAVLESAAMNEAQLSHYCRVRGLYPEHIKQWREACEQANDWQQAQSKILKVLAQKDKKRIRELEVNLRRKEKH